MDKGEFPEEVLDYLQSLDNYLVVYEIWQVLLKYYAPGFFVSQIKQMQLFIESIRTESDVIPKVFCFCNILKCTF